MTTTSRSIADCAQRVVKSDPIADLDETIAYYARFADEGSCQQVRHLRRIRDGIASRGATAPATIACVRQR